MTTLNILYEDPHILVCVKPHGIATQSKSIRYPDMVSLIRNHLAKSSGSRNPGSAEPYLAVIHRLDQPVAGILVFAKTPAAAKDLNKQLQNQGFGKYYRALVANTPSTKEGTLEEDAKLVKLPTNNLEEIKTAIDTIETIGYRTDIDAGVQIARNNFSTDTNLNKHLILLTDGVPNTVVGGPVNQYSGEVKTKTKATLQSVKDKGINIITVMTGVNSTFMPDQDGNVCAEAAGKTYKDLAEEIFGTQEAPNYGKFFYVTDSQVEDTITQDIFENVVTIIKNEIKDIVLVDYFPSIILANYNFEIVEQANIGKVTAEVNTENNSITWTIGVLQAGETASFKYKLVLKENFDRTIINVETPTNEKVDVTYTDTKGTEQKATSDVSPSIMLKKPEDNTQAETPIPQTGDTNIFAIIAITATVIAMTIYTIKYMKK